MARPPLERAIVTLDTSALFALLNRRDPDHDPRHGGTVLTLDNRHFGTVAREGTITLLPA